MAAASKTKTPARNKAAAFKRVAKPDSIDFRDRPFRPNVSVTPAPALYPPAGLPVKHQGATNACTGFALSLVVEHLLRKSRREKAPAISPFMLYSMARRYDEFPGTVRDDGSSLRGALKGWFKHGACADRLFPDIEMPDATADTSEDWWLDAVKRPLGAYYRVDPQSITDMHAALNEVGILLASAGCHKGWDEGNKLKPRKQRPRSIAEVWTIPVKPGAAAHEGHAFAIVGYNEQGFLVHNSWGPEWGSHGYAILTYDDWQRNAMDCWVAQLGVVTREHEAIAGSVTLRKANGKVQLAASRVLRDREISPFILNMGNNGALSNSGAFRTQPGDVKAMVDVHLAQARAQWKLGSKPVDVCIYAHGGLTGEDDAADTAAQWIPMLYERQIFPVFLMWETDFVSTVMNTIEDALKGVPRTTGGLAASLDRWRNERLERLLARPGSQIWGEMKQNADAISTPREGVPEQLQAGAVLLYQHFKGQAAAGAVRLHLVGHSAGAVVATYMAGRLIAGEMAIESVSFMAPAVKVETFDKYLKPHLHSGKVGRFQQFHLSDQAEQDDPSCGPYGRSLLYLVSESFEGGTRTPLLGMQKYFDPIAGSLPNTLSHASPMPAGAGASKLPPVRSSTHGGFDNDPGTQARVLDFIKQ